MSYLKVLKLTVKLLEIKVKIYKEIVKKSPSPSIARKWFEIIKEEQEALKMLNLLQNIFIRNKDIPLDSNIDIKELEKLVNEAQKNYVKIITENFNYDELIEIINYYETNYWDIRPPTLFEINDRKLERFLIQWTENRKEHIKKIYELVSR